MSSKTIKSVRRIFEILELFDRERRPLAAKEIAKQLDYPLMSAHALLKSMMELGYADFDPPNWTYLPSRSFVSVLEWVPDILDRERALLNFANELNQATGETINISRQVNTQARIIHGLESINPIGVVVKVGTMMPLSNSLTGMTLLASMEEKDRSWYVNNLSANDPHQASELNGTLIDDVVGELTDRGTVAKCDMFLQGVGAVCFPVNTIDKRDRLVVGVVGPSDRIMADEEKHRKSIKRLASEHGIDAVYPLQ